MGRFRLRKTVRQRLAAAVVVAGLVTSLATAGLAGSAFEGFRLQTHDSFFPIDEYDPRVVVVGVDSKMRREFDDPDRAKYAEVLTKLFDDGAAVVTFDVVFDKPRPEDPPLIAAMAKGIVVLGFDTESDLPRPGRRRGPRRVRDLSPLPAALVDAAKGGVGHVHVLPDPADGVVREIPLVLDAEEADLPSLSLATVMALDGVTDPVTVRPFGIEVGKRLIPTVQEQRMVLSFSNEIRLEGSQMISMADVVANRLPPATFKDRIVLIGAADPLLGDHRRAPIDKSSDGIPGVFLHANAISTILTERFVTPVSNRETLLWVFFLTLLVALATLFAPLWVGLLVPFVLGAFFYLWSVARFEAGFLPEVLYPEMMIVLALLLGQGVRYLTEGRARRRATALFGQYIPPAAAKRLLDEERVDSAVQGERLEVSVLFCDLRGFTAQAAKMEPPQVRDMLELYYLELGQMIQEHGGTLMQYVGDEIYAVFGAPELDPEHARKAFQCGLDMQNARPRLGAMLAERDLPPIFYGIGLNAGSVVAAHVGSEKLRRQYSLIGDTVNIGSRFCTEAREDHVCFSEDFRQRVGETPPLEDLGEKEFKNATRPIRVWRYWANKEDEAGKARHAAAAAKAAAQT